MNIPHLAILLQMFVFLTLSLAFSCKNPKQDNSYHKTSFKEEISLSKKDTVVNVLNTCKTPNTDIKISIQEINKDSTKIVLQTTSQLEYIFIENNNLDFPIHKIRNIYIGCSDYSFFITYQEKLGNNYVTTNHVFQRIDRSEEFYWTKIYKIESTREGFTINGLQTTSGEKFIQYNGNEGDVVVEPIYSFSGFQEGKNPNLKDYLRQMNIFSDQKNLEKLELYGDPIIIDHLMDIIKINENNLSTYNDIAHYLEQGRAYKESVSLLEKIITEFPERTVAYINLGDAYWELKNMKNAKEAYRKYLEQMESQDKLDKIPSRIIKRFEKL